MASLKDLRMRITSVSSTKKITKAMNMVAASKLRKAQERVEAARPYAERMERMLGSLGSAVAGSPAAPKLLSGTGREDSHLLVIASADRGLCGGFNAQIIRAARLKVESLTSAGKTVKVITVGNKANSAMKRELGDSLIAHFDLDGGKKVGFELASAVSQQLLDLFEDGAFDVCTLFYNKFVNVITQELTEQQLIPANIEEDDAAPANDGAMAQYEFEPDEATILEHLLPRNLSMQIYQGLLENNASEQGARMTAMDNATRNAGDMIDRLTLEYNRSRQAKITSELIEIISGAEAV